MGKSKMIIPIKESHDGNGWVQIYRANSRRELSKMVKGSNWRDNTGCGRDCTGEIFLETAELLRAYHVDGEWVGVVYRTQARDV